MDYDEEVWSGVIHSAEPDIRNGYFFEEKVNKWMIIRNGACSGSLENCYNWLEMLLELESIWDKLNRAIEKDSLNRQFAAVKSHNKDYVKMYMEFLNSFKLSIITNVLI